VIVGAIESSSKKLEIWPESERPKKTYDSERTYGKHRAATTALQPGAAVPATVSPKAAVGRGRWYAGKDDNEETETDPATHQGDERYDPVDPSWKAVGGGSDAKIYFTPGGGSNKACAAGHGTCAELDEDILVHEMVHALRMMQGLFNPVPTTLRYKNEEEFLAIVVTNVHISKQRGNHLLRPDYQKVGPMQSPWNTTAGFLKNDENKRILEYYSTKWQPIFGQLGDVHTGFNPFSAFKTAKP
jgi:hypothetical protein